MKKIKLDVGVILAGGLGKRLRPITSVIPKPLLQIKNKTIIESIILNLKKNGIKKIYIATNYMHEKFIYKLGDGSKYGVNLKYSKERKKLGTAGPLSLLKDEINQPFLVINGDILTSGLSIKKIFKNFLKQKSMICVVTKKIITPFRFGKVFSKDNKIIKIEEKPKFIQEIIAGIYIMDQKIFSFIPTNKYYGMDDLIKKLLSKKQKVSKYLIRNYWLDIGQITDYEKAKK